MTNKLIRADKSHLKYGHRSMFTFMIARRNIIGYKKVYGRRVIRVLIPRGTKIFHGFEGKCRAREVIPLEDGLSANFYEPGAPEFRYVKGKRTRCVEMPGREFDREITCVSGIHFFIDYRQAIGYY